MKKHSDQPVRLSIRGLLPGLLLAIGLSLMIYMILVEDEPGAIPLLLVATGLGWLVVRRVKRSHADS